MCDKCMLNVGCAEFHYLFTCSCFDEKRKLYLGEKKFQNPNMFKVWALFLLARLVLLRSKICTLYCSLFDVYDKSNIGAVVTSLNEAAPSSCTTSCGTAISCLSRYTDFYFV